MILHHKIKNVQLSSTLFVSEYPVEEPSMILISGQPGNFTFSQTFDISWEECILKCLADAMCARKHLHFVKHICKAHNGTLTGPANSDEYDYMQDISNSSKYTSNPDSYNYLTYWIDGMSTDTEFLFEDLTHNGSTNYPWSGGTPQK
ncbi:Protein CBG21134 [Caenorhabditis briggsae]|uniref:Protein CBG21134 n=1 Tax=Caenorhabditis briggsae TaxID=6238 RepID=A8XZE6_CAEBR|nr:Protein CBG21134 [Caenorhabditis briggsae]CAP38073.2 Protein CBG21134 [Caenorhabditis briggsae]